MAKYLRWVSPAWMYTWLVYLLILLLADRAIAQSAFSSTITSLQFTDFPAITAFLDVRDEHGDFVPRLQVEQIVVVEDNVPHPVTELVQLDSGVLIAAVVNPGAPFAIRDGQGLSRYDRLLEALSEWAVSQDEGDLDLSLFITNGPEIYHLSDPQEWMTILLGHQADFRRAEPNLDVLDRAIDIVSGPSPMPGMGRAILFITPPLEGDLSLGLQTLASRAQQQEVRIFVWMVASSDTFTSRAASQLAELASQTNGYFFAYSGIEAIPDLKGYLEPLSSVYQFSYDSSILEAGTHEIYLEIYTQRVWRDGVFTAKDILTSTAPYSFDLDIQPPNPVFISPPSQIERIDGQPGAREPLELYPEEQNLTILIEFPDRMSRPLIATTLFVDDIPVAQNTKAPFDSFQWNLKGYIENSEHMLRVEAVDSLGLKGTSIETPIRIMVTRQPRSLWSILSNHVPLLAGVIVVLSGSVLFLVLILGGGVKPRVFGLGKKRAGKNAQKKGLSGKRSDPLTQPVVVQQQHPARRLPGWMNALPWSHRGTPHKARAYLTCLSEKDRDKLVAPLPVATEDLSFGMDPQQCTFILDDASIDALHACLKREGDSYRIIDMGSTAGTWVNYTPVSDKGTLLEHGDLVHIGRMGFRFTMRTPDKQNKPVIIRQEPLE
jgi:hypothetical protein